MNISSESHSETLSKVEAPCSIKVSFIGLPDADQATFKRVITFCAARGQHFEVSSLANADVLITDDQTDSIDSAKKQQGESLLLVVTNDQDCKSGDIQLQRPLLVTRVMRTMETISKQVTPSVAKPQAPTKPESHSVKEPQKEVKDSSDVEAIAATSGKSYLALIIDDSAAIRKQLEIELRTSGMQSEFAESGEEALEKIASNDYDLIFLDIMMPGIDGYETCGQIRKDPRYKKTPVIMLSGKTSPLDEVKGVLAGASTYLTKPVKHQQFQEVTQRITRWLDEYR